MSASVQVMRLPGCNFECASPAEYDFKTVMGPWANGCEKHWKQHRLYQRLGTGMGQRLILKE